MERPRNIPPNLGMAWNTDVASGLGSLTEGLFEHCKLETVLVTILNGRKGLLAQEHNFERVACLEPTAHPPVL